MLTLTKFLEIARGKTNPRLWNLFWLFAPMAAIVLLPLGSIFLYILGLVGFDGVGRLTQMLILFSIIYGILIGIIVLLFAGKLGIPPTLLNKIKWLARFAVVTPLLTTLILFLIFSR
jgi:hypothetical protein